MKSFSLNSIWKWGSFDVLIILLFPAYFLRLPFFVSICNEKKWWQRVFAIWNQLESRDNISCRSMMLLSVAFVCLLIVSQRTRFAHIFIKKVNDPKCFGIFIISFFIVYLLALIKQWSCIIQTKMVNKQHEKLQEYCEKLFVHLNFCTFRI